MKVSKLRRWDKITLDGEGNLVIVKNNSPALTLDKSVTKGRALVKNFSFYGVKDGLIDKLRLFYTVAKYIFKKEVKSDGS